jgi:hypothetical protein
MRILYVSENLIHFVAFETDFNLWQIKAYGIITSNFDEDTYLLDNTACHRSINFHLSASINVQHFYVLLKSDLSI